MSLQCGFQKMAVFSIWETKFWVVEFQIYRNTNTGLPESNYGYRSMLKEEGIQGNENELRDDGGSIRSGIWEVTWHEDYVEVILSGDEQFDEQVILYFDGRKEIKQLTTDKEEHTESGDVNEIEGITSQ